MRVLVTRAEPGASETCARLVALGHDAIAAPALRIEPIPGAIDTNGAQAILFTSSNGARVFAALSPERAPPAFCVGEATAHAARTAGFSVVHAADGDLHALAALVAATLKPTAGRLLHAGGADLAGDLAGLLRAHGFDVSMHVCYRAVEADALAQPAKHALAQSPPAIDAVLFHSARGAAAFVKQVKDSLADIDALCLSGAVANAARAVSWRAVHIADSPDESALLALLGRADIRSKAGQDSH